MDQIAEVLGTNFVGAYVFGSLAMDAWNPQNSDIDLLIITEQLPEAGEIARLERAHNYFSQSVTGSRLEGEYSTFRISMLRISLSTCRRLMRAYSMRARCATFPSITF
jgi:hypothetical protein